MGVIQYADDSCLFHSVHNIQPSEIALNRTLSSISAWFRSMGLEISTFKSTVMVSRKVLNINI